ncbi:MAG: 2-oxoglutarate dehydrogenase E1 component, partial [Proteobacteria bacterium]|nr:2-oxoglutarate dehydrogenase E1 component [Pseudomonadota bacterium]
LQRQYESSPIHASTAPYVEALYEAYLDDPGSVSEEWRRYFGEFGDTQGDVSHRRMVREAHRQPTARDVPHRPVGRSVPRQQPAREVPERPVVDDVQTRPQQSLAVAAGIGWEGSPPAEQASEKQAAVSRLIQVYSLRGHQIADLDPLGLWQRSIPAVMKLDFLGLDETDLDAEFFTGGLAGTGHSRMKLRDILDVLKRVYCGRIAMEFAHISRARERLWLRQRFEEDRAASDLGREERRRIYASLNRAEGLERYLNTKFVGQKRFSLEGGETLIPILDDLIRTVGERGIQEVVIGMAHRGRLNVLVNVLGKSPQELFSEFAVDRDLSKIRGSGDVKYHMGFSADVRTPGNNVHVVLAFNPSHLEIVNAVVEGSVRARQDRRGDIQGNQVLPVLIHGDAAFAGQGVVAETFQMSQTRHFHTGGTIHIVINNQIGFTISDLPDARSTPYCSDIAKMVEAPVFHVNGDDPEAAVAAIRLAARYRQAFHKDVVIDLVCYRRLGHNEADEPAVTQPVMYNRIRKHATSRTLYGQRLLAGGDLSESEPRSMEEDYRSCLDEGRSPNEDCLGTLDTAADTRISLSELRRLGALINTVPKGWKVHPRVQRIVSDRVRMAAGELSVDWGFAESLAYGSILDAGFNVRLIGQDSRRGTFFHRHASFVNQADGEVFVPLEHVTPRTGAFTVGDSLLSEEAVLGFEYGYSTASPDCLVIWEAQFGDFANGAQVVIDQFISSGESKWGRLSGLTLFLPHGYEGQGPEHSSARLERFLQLCAEHNMQVCVPSTPAQMFHMLRRQALRPTRKPLIVMTPKSLLRHRSSVSTLSEITEGRFNPLIDDETVSPEDARRLIFCSGRVYYDLAGLRSEHSIEDMAIVRLEELYPFPVEEYAATIARYAHVSDIVWCQEEPQLQGAWYQLR